MQKCYAERYFLVDPVCAQGRGHNLPSLRHFSDLIENLTGGASLVIRATSRCISQTVRNQDLSGIDPHFTFCYGDIQFLSDDSGRRFYPELYSYPIPIPMPFSLYAHAFDEHRLSAIRSTHSKIEERAFEDLLAFFLKYSLGCRDCLFYPSVDIYSVRALKKVLLSLSPANTPLIVLKFIHVMEYWSPLYYDPLTTIFSDIAELITLGFRIKISTEAPGYSDYIQNTFGLCSTPLPLPVKPRLHEGFDSLLKAKPVILFPGTQRFDKGLEKIPSIIHGVTQYLGVESVEIILQEPTHNDINEVSASIYGEIMKYPNCRVYSSTISDDKLKSLFSESKCICLPYCESTYSHFRSSASYMEAASYCRPIVSTNCPGFSSNVESYSLGLIASDSAAIARELVNVLSWNADNYIALRDRLSRFFELVDNFYSELLSIA